MDDPVKVIYRYKNNNKKIQYHIYIYIGDLVSKDILNILSKIKNKDFFDSLLLLTDKDQKNLVKEYGEYWYEKFFNSYHINYTKNNIKKNNAKKNQLFEKYGEDWYKFHFIERDLTARKVTYNYESVIKSNLYNKDTKKKKQIIEEDDDILDYTINKKQKIDNIFIQKRQTNINKKLIDRTSEESYSDEINDITLRKIKHTYKEYKASLKDQSILKNINALNELSNLNNLNPDGITMGTIYNKNIETLPLIYQLGGDKENEEEEDDDDDDDDVNNKDNLIEEEEFNLEDIEEMYKNIDVTPDNNVNQTSKMITKALDDNKLFDKLNNEVIKFDKSKDNLMYDEELKNVYSKIYVNSQYIFKDDTIKVIKNKICCSIKNNSKFDDNMYLIPSRQYLWSEYYYKNNIEKVMMGHKWIKKNELLNIDIEPNSNLRTYENLKGNLKYLKHNIKRYGSKIKMEDDEYNILYNYNDYMIANEIFLLDVYNDIGHNYEGDEENLKNIIDVYFKIYFPKINSDDIKHIFNLLNNKNKNIELSTIKTIYETINNDLVLLNEITTNVELIKKNNIDYKYIFKETNYITQSVIHVYLKNLNIDASKKQEDKMSLTIKNVKSKTDINLFRVFDNFIINDDYPFVQYQTSDGNLNFKFNNKNLMENQGKKNLLSKWFENAPYGINFKVKIKEKNIIKFIAINLSSNGKIEYKTQWKEEDMAKIEDVVNTYDYIKNLIRKINNENKKINIEIPNNDDFKFAFINTIQKFELPNKFIINHNDLSEFSRYFFPYVALVIEPRKRQSKIKKEIEKSKFGTYLRFKRVNKYENQTRIEHRILYFIRNYEYNTKSLANEISKQFNITIERATEEILNIETKYPNIKKSRKILKKLENIPKYKPPGIGLDIQGKKRDNYKIRISGARNKPQLQRILTFINILLYLYIETYLYKKPERQKLKNKLKQLTNIAKRRNKVDDIVNYDTDTKEVKKMTMLDKKRIGFKPEKGQMQWTRSCQNSGDDKKRRPQLYTDETIRKLINKGYYLNKKLSQYEKKHVITKKGGKKKEIILRTIKLKDLDGTKNVYYGCNPEENGEHMHVGFLSKSNNPFGQCMPCCFKKDALFSKNKEKKDYYLKCIGQEVEEDKKSKALGDKLYILQDTNKIQEGRFGFLPKNLDIFINQILNKDRKIKNHYLIQSKSGYFFKYGTLQDDNKYLNCITSFFDITIEDIKKKIINTLKKNSNNLIFTSLNNGDIKTQFKTSKEYISFIENSSFIDYDIINDILSIPGTMDKNGLNIIIFEKKVQIINTLLDKEEVKEDFIILCNNTENIDTLNDVNRKNILILKEDNNYYPIIMVKKPDDNIKNMTITKIFNYENTKNNIINHIIEYYRLNCSQKILNQMYLGDNLIAKHLYKILLSFDKIYNPKYQIIDSRNKCIYLVTNNDTLIPTKPSGSIYNLEIKQLNYDNLKTFDDTIKNLKKISELSKGIIKSNPIGVYIESNTEKNVKITAVITESNKSLPIKPELYSKIKLKEMNYIIEEKSIDDNINKEIEKGNNNILYDKRIQSVNKNKYLQESYQLFRLEISEFLKDNDTIKNKIDRIINDKKLDKNEKRNKIKSIIYKITNKELQDVYDNLNNNQTGGDYKLINISSNKPNLENYKINNNRDVCAVNVTKDVCNNNTHCAWANNQCKLSLTNKILIDFVNRISEEFINNDLKKEEIFQSNNYFVSDIVDYKRFTERPNQKIIKSNNTNIKKMLSNIFGKDNIPKIGKRRGNNKQDIDLFEMNIKNSMKDMGDYYIQPIIENNNSIYRAFANCLFWYNNTLFDETHRNLGYFSDLQTNLSNYFKSLVIDWLIDKRNKNEIINNLYKYIDDSKKNNFIKDFVIKLSNDRHTLTNCVIETYILSKKYNKVVYVFNQNNKLIYIYDNAIVYDSKYNSKYDKKYLDDNIKNNGLHIRFNYITYNINPDQIDVIYMKT